MKYNLLGSIGLKVSELCLDGHQQIKSGTGRDALVKRPVDAGIDFIDTANVCSEGLPEEMTGKATRNMGLKRDNLVIATNPAITSSLHHGPG